MVHKIHKLTTLRLNHMTSEKHSMEAIVQSALDGSDHTIYTRWKCPSEQDSMEAPVQSTLDENGSTRT